MNDNLPETVEILCVDCKETKTVPYSINPQYRCNDCAGKGIRSMTALEFSEDDCPSCDGTGFSGYARTFDETCSCCLGTGKLPKAFVSTE